MGSICLKQGRLSVGSNLLAILPPLGELEGAGAAPLSPPEGGRRVKRGGRDSGAFSQSLLGAAIFLRSVSSWVRLSPFSAAVQDLIFWRCEKTANGTRIGADRADFADRGSSGQRIFADNRLPGAFTAQIRANPRSAQSAKFVKIRVPYSCASNIYAHSLIFNLRH